MALASHASPGSPQAGRRRFRRLLRRRALGITTEGARFILLTFAVGVAAVNTGNNLFYLLLAMMLSLVVLSGLLSEYCVRRLTFHRHLPADLIAGQSTAAALWIANHKTRLPSLSLRLVEVVDGHDMDRGIRLAYLEPNGSSLISYPLMMPRRGRRRFEGIRVVTTFPFGLFEKQAWYPGAAELVVCPALIPPPALPLDLVQAFGHDQALARRGPGTSLYNLREFRPGDDSRAIHWMTTARTSKLMLKETEAEEQSRITLAVSTVVPPEHDAQFERMLSIAASLIDVWLEQGHHVRLLLGDHTDLSPGGSESRRELLHTLALCEPKPLARAHAVHESMRRALSPTADQPTLWLTALTDPETSGAPPASTHVVAPYSHGALFDAAGPGLSA